MTHNIMQEYINISRENIQNTMKIILGNHYDEKIAKVYLDRYINVRYLNYDIEEKQNVFYRRIYMALKAESQKLILDFPTKTNIIESTLAMYQYIFYIDGVRKINDLDEFVEIIYARIIKNNDKPKSGFKEKLHANIKKNFDIKEKFLKQFDTQDFELDIKKYSLIKDVYRVNLNYKFKIPYIYSDLAINEVFNEKLIYEDKILIESMLLTQLCIKEISVGNFYTKYLIEFPVTLFEKVKKGKQLLRILGNQIIQEKINFKIKYTDFVLNREKVYELMQDGYKFAIILDSAFNVNDESMRRVDIFSYILISKNIECYEEIFKYKDEKNNFIIDEA